MLEKVSFINSKGAEGAETFNQNKVLALWADATGERVDPGSYKKGDVLRTHLSDGRGLLAKVDFHPDFLNGNHRLKIRDFYPLEGDEHYLDGIQMVANLINNFKAQDVNCAIEGPDEYSDSEDILTDIKALIVDPEEEKPQAA